MARRIWDFPRAAPRWRWTWRWPGGARRARHGAGRCVARQPRGGGPARRRAARLGGLDVQAALANVNGAIAQTHSRKWTPWTRRLWTMRSLPWTARPSKSHLGGNRRHCHVTRRASRCGRCGRPAAVGATCRAANQCACRWPQIQIFGGGAHAGRRVDVQDFLVMPIGAATFDEAMVMTAEVYRAAGELMAKMGRPLGCGGRGRLVARLQVERRSD